MSSSAEADDRFNIDPERLNQIAGEREDSERIVAVARMLMAQRARNTLDGLVGEYETPEEPDLTVTTVEEFFVVLAKRRIDQVKRETAMPQRIKFAKGFEMNLDGWNLTGCDLRNIDFSWMRFNGAILAGCNLSGSDLHNATMRGADLTGAICRGANFMAADLCGAKLIGADCTGAALDWAVFHGANLRDANFSRASMSDIVFNESFEDGVASTKAQGAIIYAATFNPVLELDDNEVIRSAADIALRLGFVQAPPAK